MQDSQNFKRSPLSVPVSEEDLSTLYRRGEVLAQLGQYHEALRYFQAITAADPRHTKAWVFQGVMQIHLEQYETAIASCHQALQLNSQESEAWIFKGTAFHRLGNYSQAYHCYEQAFSQQNLSLWQKIWQGPRKLWRGRVLRRIKAQLDRYNKNS